MLDFKKIKAASKRLGNTVAACKASVVGRDEVFSQLTLALISRNHLLLEGPPGVAKSYLADTIFNAIEGAEYFKVACTKKMSEDYLIGPLDMRLFREEGEYLHRVEGYLPTAQFAFLDEFLDLSSGALRAMLEILNERSFSRGPQRVRCPLHSCIAATNFSGDSEVSLEAVMDRFLFRAKIKPLEGPGQLSKMLAAPKATNIPKINIADIQLLAKAAESVRISPDMIKVYVDVVSKITKVSNRTVMRCLRVLQASAIIDGRFNVSVEDLNVLTLCMGTTGDPASSKDVSSAFTGSAVYKDAAAMSGSVLTAYALYRRAIDLSRLMKSALKYEDEAAPLAVECREMIEACRDLHSKSSSSSIGYDKLVQHLQNASRLAKESLQQATTIYNDTRTNK